MTSLMLARSKSLIKNKIDSATTESPIAVFTIYRDGIKCLTAVFASTFETQIKIKNKHPDLVGVYCGSESERDIDADFNKALRLSL